MRTQYAIITLILLTACSNQQTNENKVAKNESDSTELKSRLTLSSNDTLSYIDFVQKFKDNNTFYTDLYFTESFNYDLYNDIINMGSKIIFQEDESTRTRMEIDKVGQYFNLTGLKKIDIYNKDNLKLTTGQLSHIEYVDGNIESKFVAVFQVENPDIQDPVFCVGNSNHELNKIDFDSFEDEELKSQMIEYLKISAEKIWNIKHYKLNNQTIYSTVSHDTTSYIVETVDKTKKTLYTSDISEVITKFTLLSKEFNGRKIILTESGAPETDMLWTSLLIFNGTEYKRTRGQRISNR